MNEINFKDLVLENFFQWPSSLKYFMFFLLLILTAVANYWLILSSKLEQYGNLVHESVTLKTELDEKQELANPDVYSEQLENVKRRYGRQIKFLTNNNEISTLLNKISQAGQSSGITFELFAPKKEGGEISFKWLEIHIILVGEYHKLVTFLRKISKFNKLIIFKNFEISNNLFNDKKNYTNLLRMKINIKIYKFPEIFKK